jgi:hypothetical protein
MHWIDDAFASDDVIAALREVRETAACSREHTPLRCFEHQLLLLERVIDGRMTLENYRKEVNAAHWHERTHLEDY